MFATAHLARWRRPDLSQLLTTEEDLVFDAVQAAQDLSIAGPNHGTWRWLGSIPGRTDLTLEHLSNHRSLLWGQRFDTQGGGLQQHTHFVTQPGERLAIEHQEARISMIEDGDRRIVTAPEDQRTTRPGGGLGSGAIPGRTG